MKTPPFLLFAALLFWGWQSDLLLVGAFAGAALEAARFVNWRWDFEDTDFHRIYSFCVLVTVGVAAYIFTTSDQGGGLAGIVRAAAGRQAGATSGVNPIAVFRWLPLIFFPFIGAQLYNVRPTVPLTAVSLVLRLRRRRGEDSLAGRYLDISYPYFIVCVFAAGIHASHADLDLHTCFWGQVVLVLWALWAVRARRFGPKYWALALAVVIALGFLGQLGIREVEKMVQNFNVQLFARLFRARIDPTQSQTALGQLGDLKLSPRIVIRLEPEQPGVVPAYLREASYRTYKVFNQTWHAGAGANDFSALSPQPDNTTWILLSNKVGTATVNVACYLNGRSHDGDPQGVLPLPSGCCRLLNLPNLTSVIALQTNRTGVVLATGSGLMIFDARYGPGATIDSPPDTTGTNRLDLAVPTNEVPALAQVIAEMNLDVTNFDGASEAQKRLLIAQFFAHKFSYSTWQGPAPRSAVKLTPLTRFLLETHSGHCEYFATATVLLLRQLGIPARYAVGYAVHEASGSGYVVRERDAHAWCLAWDQQAGQWVDFDTTPASWIAVEGGRASLADWLSDARAWLVFQFEKLRWRQSHLRQYILWTLLPVMAVLLYYIIFQRRTKAQSAKRDAVAETPVVWPGQDSAFYRLEKTLASRSLPREPGEPLADWLERAVKEPGVAELRNALRELLILHYRYRFDPPGLNEDEKKLLAQNADAVQGRLMKK